MFICYSIELFKYLVGVGFIPEFQRRDFKKSSIKVWGFKDTPELRLSIKQYGEVRGLRKEEYNNGNS